MDEKSTEKERIERIMQSENLNSGQFAAEIGIKGSTLSHILNGRNNPSLEVLKKILDRYRMISSDWLILGVGQMYRSGKQSQTPSLFDDVGVNNSKHDSYRPKTTENNSTIKNTIQEKIVSETTNLVKNDINSEVSSKIVKKIIVYYADNTFQEFETK